MSIPPTSPSLPILDTEALRRRLAGLADPFARAVGATEGGEIQETANRLYSILAHLFGSALDRLTLWSKIDAATATACAKVSDGDLARFVSLCLESIQADAAKAAGCDALGQLLATFAVRPAEWRHAFVDHIHTHRYAVLVFGRARWEAVKAKEVEL